jgi:hypothetical protein
VLVDVCASPVPARREGIYPLALSRAFEIKAQRSDREETLPNGKMGACVFSPGWSRCVPFVVVFLGVGNANGNISRERSSNQENHVINQ